jgi:multisubunit Na+/H+ antiporter MnhC subunit
MVYDAINENAEWRGILDENESILWQGKPSDKLRLEFRSPLEPLSLVFFIGFSVLWMGELFFFFFCAFGFFGVYFWQAYVRTKTHLTLTDNRAIIATAVMGKRTLKSYPITRTTELEFVDGPLGSIFFAKETIEDLESTIVYPIGFESIENAREVFALFRKVQQGLP